LKKRISHWPKISSSINAGIKTKKKVKMKTKETISLLIVEDNSMLRDSLKMLLESFEKTMIIKVQEADSGEAAIEKVKEKNFDIILMDNNMPPGISGPEATRRILKIKPEIKILGLSNYEERALVEEMMNAGANGYLLKDIEKKELIEAIKTVIAGGTYYCKRIRKKFNLG